MRTHCAAFAAILLCLALGIAPATVTATAEGAGGDHALEIEQIGHVPYLLDPDGMTHELSVYAPTVPGPWPTAVMIHGGGGDHGASLAVVPGVCETSV